MTGENLSEVTCGAGAIGPPLRISLRSSGLHSPHWRDNDGSSIRTFFERYESVFNRSLGGDIDMDEVASLYASAFIAASPAGVMTGKNDDQLKQVMAQGYARYRAMGTKEMRIRNVRLSPMDDHHCVAHVAWTATYARKDQPDVR